MKTPFLLLVLLFMPTLMISAAPPALPTGASLAWTSTDPAIVQARELINTGELAKAEALLRGHSSDTAAVETLEIIRRIRQDYSLTAADMLKKLQPSIRELTTDDISRWTQTRELQARTIDGQLAYFRREPSNLFRFCPDAIARRLSSLPSSSDTALTDHLAQVIAEAKRTGKVEVAPIAHRIRFTLTVPANTPGAKAGGRQTDLQQS